MPTYAYACKDCGHAFDIVQSFSEDSLTECPQCSGRLRKKFGNIGVTFKGSGFYRTDSRASSSSSDSSAGSGSSSSSSSDAGGSSSGSSDAGSSNGSSSSNSSSSGASSGTSSSAKATATA
nr:FmdB family zinc ribbon protein [Nesterenkonia alba]